MTDADLSARCNGLVEGRQVPACRDALLDVLWNVDQAPDIGRVIDPVRITGASG